MNVVCRVNISCNIVELQQFRPFIRAMDFATSYADITIYCIDDGRSLQFVCSPDEANCFSWRKLKQEWERKYGPLWP